MLRNRGTEAEFFRKNSVSLHALYFFLHEPTGKCPVVLHTSQRFTAQRLPTLHQSIAGHVIRKGVHPSR